MTRGRGKSSNRTNKESAHKHCVLTTTPQRGGRLTVKRNQNEHMEHENEIGEKIAKIR